MKKVIKVIMYVYRNNNGKKEFFALHRQKGDVVVLTGHVGDFIKDETIEQAAAREVEEELGVKPQSMLNLEMFSDVYIKEKDVQAREHAFLIEIPNKDVHFLEGDERHQWYSLQGLSEVLTYSNQRKPLGKIEELL
jgi:8-oxo-dGTP pyrophosphatase MutT (NUDIX family)